MILAAGRGERMRPLTDTLPKPLLQVGGRALIEWHLLRLVQAGVREVVINHAHLGQQIEQQLGDGRHYGLHVRYSPEAVALETAGGIVQALPLLGDQPFLVINADIYTDYPYAQLSLADNLLAHLILVPNPEHNSQGDFHLTATGILQATGEPRTTYCGLGIYHPQLFAGITPGKHALAPLLRQAMAAGRISGEVYLGRWVDVGTPARLNELNAALRAG
jgi:MurNAc alpha-1-phosphate uridylyltransferase